MNQTEIEGLISRALEEDIKSGDITTNSIIDETTRAEAVWIAKEQGIIAGLDIARKVFQALDKELEWNSKANEGEEVEPGTEVAEIKGSCRAILTAERTALNLTQRMSGIASKTHRFKQELKELPTKILDTRKTIPGFRTLDKYAVRTGGGTNHRMGLYDMAMIKDNHIVAAGGIEKAVKQVRSSNEKLKIEVETTSLNEVKQALAAGADVIMFDNMSFEMMREAVSLIDHKAETEASGNITLESLKDIAGTGVDYISAGALTHSVEAFDISQQLQKIIA